MYVNLHVHYVTSTTIAEIVELKEQGKYLKLQHAFQSDLGWRKSLFIYHHITSLSRSFG